MISHAKISRHQSTASQLPPITPEFLLPILVPLYVAWFFYMLRFYMMPWFLGYSVMGMLSFPREGEIARAIYKAFSP